MAETNGPRGEEDKGPVGNAIENIEEFLKTHPSLWFETPRSGLIETAHHLLAHHPGLVLKAVKFGPSMLLTGVGTAVDDVVEGKLDPSKRLSREEIAEHVAINLGTSVVAEALLGAGLVVAASTVGLPVLVGAVAAALIAPTVGALVGDSIFDDFVRRAPSPSAAETPTLEMNPDALHDLSIPGPLSGAELDQSALAPFLGEPPISQADNMGSGIVITVSGDGAAGDSPGFGSPMSKSGTGGGFGDGMAGSGARSGDQSRLALPNDVPHGSYAFTRFMLDGPDPEPAWLQNLRMNGLDGVDGFPGFGDGKAQVQFDAVPALKSPRVNGGRLLLGLSGSAFPSLSRGSPGPSGSFNLDPLELPRPMAGERLFENGTTSSFLDARRDVLPDLSFGSGESPGSGIADPIGIVRIIAAIDQLGERLSERPVNAFLDGRDVTDIVNRHNARGSNGPLGSTSAFDSSAGFTPYGARTE
ncbi:MAG TPA: hypothetical protein VM689_20600 [Aliidongia sp.]|nr:hypothetical protein [Aliidongia sp.]